MKQIALPTVAVCLIAFGVGAAAPPARASAEGRRNTAILLGIAAVIAADKYADKRAEEACRSYCGYYDCERYQPRHRTRPGPRWHRSNSGPRHDRGARVVVRVERRDYCYYHAPCDRGRPHVGRRDYDDGPRYWREPWYE